MAVSKPMQTEFGIHYRLDSCVPFCLIHVSMVVLQIFCDRGAERKARDEERRASKRRMTSTGAKKRLDDLYHVATERSEFYTMANRDKPPVSVACAT